VWWVATSVGDAAGLAEQSKIAGSVLRLRVCWQFPHELTILKEI
jgi:hypothetical protein